MKKIIALSLFLVTLSVAASAQTAAEGRFRKSHLHRGFNNGQITRPERVELRNDAIRYQMLKHRVRRDGIVTPFERRRLRKARCEARRDAFRFKHNGRRRLI